jgi:hypothetical protein
MPASAVALRVHQPTRLQARLVHHLLAQIRQDRRIAQDPVLADLEPPMPLMYLPRYTQGGGWVLCKAAGLREGEAVRDDVGQLRLILLERQDVVGLLLPYLRGNRRLAARRFDGHQTPHEFQLLHELGGRP